MLKFFLLLDHTATLLVPPNASLCSLLLRSNQKKKVNVHFGDCKVELSFKGLRAVLKFSCYHSITRLHYSGQLLLIPKAVVTCMTTDHWSEGQKYEGGVYRFSAVKFMGRFFIIYWSGRLLLESILPDLSGHEFSLSLVNEYTDAGFRPPVYQPILQNLTSLMDGEQGTFHYSSYYCYGCNILVISRVCFFEPVLDFLVGAGARWF